MRSIRLAMAVGAVIVVTTLVAPGVAYGAAGDPALVTGKKAGPVSIPVTQKTVASLALTKGRWLVIAKAVLAGTGGTNGAHLGVDCRLVLGSRSDLISAAPRPHDADGSRVPILLTTAGKLRGAGPTQLRCAGEVGGAVKIRDIRITAIKVGTLTTRSTVAPAGSFGPSATTGTGKPVVTSAKQGSPRSVTGNGTYRPVAELPLAEGRWWIVAKGVADDGSTASSYRCRISAGGDVDVVGFPLTAAVTAGDVQPFALQVTHDFGGPGHAELECQGDHDFRVANVVIDAIQLGKLTKESLETTPAATTGSGTPRVIAGWNDGPIGVPVGSSLKTIVTQPLPKGQWLVVVKAWFEAAGVPSDSTLRSVACQLGLSGFKDDMELRYGQGTTHVGMVVLQVPASTSAGQSAVLRCRRTEAGGTGDLLHVKLTALRLRSILAWRL